jgi:hypothetical protein
MPLFNQSTKTTAAAIAEIADSAGASADSDMLARATRSLAAAFGHFNNYANWRFTLTEATPILVTAPFTLTAITASAGLNYLVTPTTAAAVNVYPLDFVQSGFTSVPQRVVSTATAGATGRIVFGETFNTSIVPTTAAGDITVNRDCYDLPSDFKQPYDVRMLGAQYTLRPLGRRHYDRSITTEFTFAGTPLYYDVFLAYPGGKIRVLRPPAQTDRLAIKYYRRMQATSATCDIPADYDQYLIAFAKWHLLSDKADASDRATTWFNFANGGLKQMVMQEVKQPDEDLLMIPGHYSMNVSLGPNSVRPYLDEW